MTREAAGWRTFCDAGSDRQTPFDVAVVMPSIVKPGLRRAIESVFAQSFGGTIQMLIGIDKAAGDPAVIAATCENRPKNCVVTVFDPGYSTSDRHGGLYPSHDGGALRTILSFAANSRYIAYLDDDNWWHADHLASLLAVIDGFDWAFSLRWLMDPETFEPLCIDDWESVGPALGVYAEKFGGFVDPNCLMIDKLACGPLLHWWTTPLPNDSKRMSADRYVFNALRTSHPVAWTGRATTFYVMDPDDVVHKARLNRIRHKRKAGTTEEIVRWAPATGK